MKKFENYQIFMIDIFFNLQIYKIYLLKKKLQKSKKYEVWKIIK